MIVAKLLERLIPSTAAAGRLQYDSPLQSHSPRVFELGCGTGATVNFLADAYSATGADISRHAIEFARANYPACRFIAFDELTELAGEIHQADCVLLLDVLEHVEDDFRLLSQLVSLMRPGAHLILTVPHDPALWSEHDEALFHFRRYEPMRLRSTWEGLPVEERLFGGMNYRLAPLIRAARWYFNAKRRSESGSPSSVTGSSRSNLAVPNVFANRLLSKVFSGEARPLVRALHEHRAGTPVRTNGISLIAVLQRTAGPGMVRNKPPQFIDEHRPAAFDLGRVSS